METRGQQETEKEHQLLNPLYQNVQIRKDPRLNYFKEIQDTHQEPYDVQFILRQDQHSPRTLTPDISSTPSGINLTTPPASPSHYSNPVYSQNTKTNPYLQQGNQVLQHQMRVNTMNMTMLNNLPDSPYKSIPNGNSRQVNLSNFVSQSTIQNRQNMLNTGGAYVNTANTMSNVGHEYHPDPMLEMMSKQKLDEKYAPKKNEKETILQAMQARHRLQQQLYHQQRLDGFDKQVDRQQLVKKTFKGPDDRYGMLGLLGVIKNRDQDINILTLGLDLTTMGLNLNSPDYLYPTFASPWNDGASRIKPEFKIPQCYIIQPSLMPHFSTHMSKFTDETLFYIFYSMPRDLMQILAARELIAKNWKYHKEIKLWFQQVGELTAKTNTYERGAFIYFDINNWKKVQKDDFVLEYDKIFPPPIQPGQQMGSL